MGSGYPPAQFTPDARGEATDSTLGVLGSNYTTHAQYNELGAVKQQIYPVTNETVATSYGPSGALSGMTTTTGTAAQTLGGDTTLEATQDDETAGTAAAFRFVASASGTASQAVVYVDSANNAPTIQGGLYTNSGGNPGTLLAQGTLSSPTAGAWNTVNFSGVSLTTGQTYWLAILGPSSGGGQAGYRDGYVGGSDVIDVSSATNLNTLPSTFAASAQTFNGWRASGYVVQPGNQTTTTLLDAPSYSATNGLLTGAHLGQKYAYSVSYDALLRPQTTQVKRISDSATLYSETDGYDALGNVASVNTALPTGTDNQGYCYDEQNRLTWAGTSGTKPCGGTVTAGNLTVAAYTNSFAYDTLDRLTSGPAGSYVYGDTNHKHAATSVGSGYTAKYDASGNMTCRAPTSSLTCAGTITGAALN